MFNKKEVDKRYLYLPDYITMTNFCDSKGKKIGTKWIGGKCYGTITQKGVEQTTKIGFEDCTDAQKFAASEMYILIKERENK